MFVRLTQCANIRIRRNFWVGFKLYSAGLIHTHS